MFDLSNKVVVVTGGARGIGAAVCRRLARAGGSIALLDINFQAAEREQNAIRQEGGQCRAWYCDITDYGAVEAVMACVFDALGSVDTLVNNAAIAHVGSVATTTEQEFAKVTNVNIKGVFHGIKAVLPFMEQQGGGCIINLASVASDTGIPMRFAYSMSKGAVSAMTRSVAVDGLSAGIRCNCIAPARVHTPFVDEYLARHYPGREQEMFRTLSKTQPVGRMGTAEEVAALVHYLASDEARFITGATLPIDGGFMTLKP